MMVSSFEEIPGECIGRGLISSPIRVTWGCHGVIAWLTQANTSVGQSYFQVFNIDKLMYYVFFIIRTYIYYIQKTLVVSSIALVK